METNPLIYHLQQVLNAAQLGSVYALIALGYTMVYGVLAMINFAHGDFFMLGAFVCLLCAVHLKLPFLAILLVSMVFTALLAVAVERLAYKPLRAAPRMSAIITALGVGIFLENFTLGFFPYPQHIPLDMHQTLWHFGGLTVSSLQCSLIALSLALMLTLNYVVSHTKFGMGLRAVAWDRGSAALMGIASDKIISATFLIGGALAGAAGVLYGVSYPVIDPYIGIMIGWKAFISAVIGGIGDIRGAMAGGFILALVEIMTASLLPSTYRDFVVFSLLVILLVVRPHGIFGKPRTQKV